MTAEQLEELLGHAINGCGHDTGRAIEELQHLAPDLARKVIAAEKLVDALDDALSQDDDHWALCRAAITAYREASK